MKTQGNQKKKGRDALRVKKEKKEKKSFTRDKGQGRKRQSVFDIL